MGYRLLADALVVLHAAFVLFVVGGSFLVWRRRWVLWLHLPACVWGALIEFYGWICPLTPWEQALRARAGQVGYTGGFIDHYLVPLIYPSGLTRRGQVVLGISVVLINAASYSLLWFRHRRPTSPRPGKKSAHESSRDIPQAAPATAKGPTCIAAAASASWAHNCIEIVHQHDTPGPVLDLGSSGEVIILLSFNTHSLGTLPLAL